jgi:hypothetical protein
MESKAKRPIETTIIKSPYQKVNMTEEEITEFVKCADPVTGHYVFYGQLLLYSTSDQR